VNLILAISSSGPQLNAQQIKDLQNADKLLEQYDVDQNEENNRPLGMAIATKLVKVMEGQLTIHSSVETTTFKISIPIDIPAGQNITDGDTLDAPLKILLVEDDTNLGQILKEYLEIKGYLVKLCRDGEEGWSSYQSRLYDFCIFDVMLPKLDGFGLAERIREHDKITPIIFLTAKSLKEDTIQGLKIGADDYITKPFRMEELLLRIQAILRRTQQSEQDPEETTTFHLGKFEFSSQTQKLNLNGSEQKLTSKESELLRLLCLSKNQVLDRSFALKKIWGDDSYFHARSMDVYITKLRKYLKQDPDLQILNVHGQGFKLIEVR